MLCGVCCVLCASFAFASSAIAFAASSSALAFASSAFPSASGFASASAFAASAFAASKKAANGLDASNNGSNLSLFTVSVWVSNVVNHGMLMQAEVDKVYLLCLNDTVYLGCLSFMCKTVLRLNINISICVGIMLRSHVFYLTVMT